MPFCAGNSCCKIESYINFFKRIELISIETTKHVHSSKFIVWTWLSEFYVSHCYVVEPFKVKIVNFFWHAKWWKKHRIRRRKETKIRVHMSLSYKIGLWAILSLKFCLKCTRWHVIMLLIEHWRITNRTT